MHQKDSQQIVFAVLFGRFLTGCRGQCPWQRGQDRTCPASSSFGASTTAGWHPVGGKTPQGIPRAPGRWKHGGGGRRLQPSSRAPSGTWTCPPWSLEGVEGHRSFLPAPPQVYLSTSSASLSGCSCAEALGLAPVSRITTPHPRARSPLREWRLGSGDRTKLGSSDPQALCQPVVLGHLVAHADAAQRWGKIQR